MNGSRSTRLTKLLTQLPSLFLLYLKAGEQEEVSAAFDLAACNALDVDAPGTYRSGLVQVQLRAFDLILPYVLCYIPAESPSLLPEKSGTKPFIHLALFPFLQILGDS